MIIFKFIRMTICLISFLISNVCFGALAITNVSGTASHGQTIIITGTDFGTKATVAPLLYDPFETGNNGKNTPSDGTQITSTDWVEGYLDNYNMWANFSGTNKATYETDTQRSSNSTYYARLDFNASAVSHINHGLVWYEDTSIGDGGKFFFSFWTQFDWGDTNDPDDVQMKWFQFCNHGSYGEDTVMLYNRTHYPNGGGPPAGDDVILPMWRNGTNGVDSALKYMDPVVPEDEWCLIQAWVELSSVGAGSIDWRILRPVSGTYSYSEDTDGDDGTINLTNINPAGPNGDTTIEDFIIYRGMVNLEGGAGDYVSNGLVKLDDVYYDNSWARVEIGNSSSYESCTQREMLVPSAWSPTSITATLYTGNLTGINYIFVVDSDGNVSPGYAVTVIATPSITNVNDSSIVHNQAITITGTDFSSKTTAAPIHFDDFESGSDGTVIAGSNVFGTATCTDCYSDYVALTASDTEAPKYSNLNNRTNSSLNARIHFDVDGTDPGSFSDSLLCYQSDVEISGKIFTQVHVRMDWAADETTDDSYQCKMFRWVGSPSISAEPSVSFSPVHKDGALDDSYNTGFSYSGPVAPNELKYVSETNPLGDETWGVLQIWGDGDSGGSNGEIHVKLISDVEQNQMDYSGKILDGAQFYAYFLIGFTMANVEAPETVDTEFYYDDFYLDNSWARVEIGNSATYTSCTELEVCPATSWGTTSITFTAKVGSQSGNAWIYVTDIYGNVSPGHPVTIGSAPSAQKKNEIKGMANAAGMIFQ